MTEEKAVNTVDTAMRSGQLPPALRDWGIALCHQNPKAFQEFLDKAGGTFAHLAKRGQGKTFLALDWACSIATGTAWQGKATLQGRVAYLLAERPTGLGRRLRGWMEHAGLGETEAKAKLEAEGVDWLVFGQKRFPLDSDRDRAELVQLLKNEFAQPDEQLPSHKQLSLLVLDPLVFFMDGSENETREMQRFVDGALELVREVGCSILLVHHEGKGNIQNILGARGSSALEAGMDSVVYLSPKGTNDISEMVVTKQREAPAIKPLFRRTFACHCLFPRLVIDAILMVSPPVTDHQIH